MELKLLLQSSLSTGLQESVTASGMLDHSLMVQVSSLTSKLNGLRHSLKILSISNKEIRKLILLSPEQKLYQIVDLMNRNKTELQEKRMVEEAAEEAEDMMIKMETTEEEEVAEEATMEEVAAVVEVAAMETEVIEEIEETEEEKTTVEEVVVMVEETTTQEEAVATVAVGVTEVVAAVPAGTMAQATTTSTKNHIIEIPTTMTLLMEVALLTLLINFQLHLHLRTLKTIELKGTTTLTPKINHHNLMDHLRLLTPLFI